MEFEISQIDGTKHQMRTVLQFHSATCRFFWRLFIRNRGKTLKNDMNFEMEFQ